MLSWSLGRSVLWLLFFLGETYFMSNHLSQAFSFLQSRILYLFLQGIPHFYAFLLSHPNDHKVHSLFVLSNQMLTLWKLFITFFRLPISYTFFTAFCHWEERSVIIQYVSICADGFSIQMLPAYLNQSIVCWCRRKRI